MKTLIVLLIALSGVYFANIRLPITSVENQLIDPELCSVPNEDNKSILEDFLTKSYWTEERSETNTNNLSVSQIKLLSDDYDDITCYTFNSTFQEAIDEKNGLDEQANNVTYYKVGSFYFVLITLKQSEDPNYVTSGMGFLVVYNQNLNLVKGYAF